MKPESVRSAVKRYGPYFKLPWCNDGELGEGLDPRDWPAWQGGMEFGSASRGSQDDAPIAPSGGRTNEAFWRRWFERNLRVDDV
jgi:hypothetical protein